MDDRLYLLNLVCTRLCHDLVGPVGAVSNGVELLEDCTPDFLAETAGLLENSAQVLTARLKFFRAAFGRRGESVTDSFFLQDLANSYILTAGTRSMPVTLEWDERPFSITEGEGVILLLSVLLAADTLVRGGTVFVSGAEGVSVRATGTDVRLDQAVPELLSADAAIDESITPKQAPAAYAGLVAEEEGVSLRVEKDEQAVLFVFE